MSSGFRPNEQMRLPGLGVPVDPWTGELLAPVTMARLARLRDAEGIVRQILHELDGSSIGARSGDRRMALAFTKFEEAMMWAGAAVLDHYPG
jgi:hypothetical protein